MGARGVAREIARHQETEYVSIWNPGFDGPEVTFFVLLEPGTHMRITSARSCMNCLGTRVDYQVDVSPMPAKFAGKPAYLAAEWLRPDQLRCTRPA